MSWSRVRGRYLFQEVNERGFDLPLASVTRDGGVEFRSDLDFAVWSPGDNTSHYKRVRPYDFVIGLRSFQSGIGYSTLKGLVSPAYTVLRPISSEVHGGFFKHLFKSDFYISRLDNVSQGIRQGRTISTEDFYNISIAIPPVTEQRAIAHYLDAESARIDALISKKHRLIELLQERWRAEVTDTVFGNVSLPWVAIRRIVDLLPGFAFPSSDYVDDGIRLLRGVNIAPGRLRWDSDVVYLAAESRPYSSEYELAAGDLVLGMDRPVVGSGLRIALVSTSDLPCHLVQRVARIRGTKFADTRYIRLVIDSDAFIAYFSPIVTGVSVPHISANQILSFRVPLPSYDVQLTLVAQLMQRLTSLTSICDRLSAQIDLLTERRQALITAAVAGEISVPGLAA